MVRLPIQSESMKPRQKTKEQYQAQSEFFGDKVAKDFSESQKVVLKYSNELAKIVSLDALPDDLPEELKKVVKENRNEYVESLRSAKKDDISFRKENIELYNRKFKAAIDTLRGKISSTLDPSLLPEYLGSGSNGSAYMIEVDGKKYAAKFSDSTTQVNFEIKPLLQAKGIANSAQLVSYSLPDGVVIMELLPGTNVTNLDPESTPEYSDEHIKQLIKTVIELYNHGVIIDPKPSNFMYDEEHGFSILDFHLLKGSRSIGDIVMSLSHALTARKWPRLDYESDEYEAQSKANTIARYKVHLPLMINFLRILKNDFPDILLDYHRSYDIREKDPRISQNQLIDRKYIESISPEFKPYLDQLTEMGF